MTAMPLFNKTRSAQVAPLKASVDLTRLCQWLERGRHERFLIEAVVTPEMAEYLLVRNAYNRPAHQPTVQTYAAAMRRGEWHLNGQNIIIADNGELNDGQHRLLAVIEADMPIALGLQFGVTRQSRATLDQGRKRTLGDHFAMAGHANTNSLAAIVRLAWNYDMRIMSMANSPSVEQALNYLEENYNISDFINVGKKIGSEFSTGGAQFSFASFVCARANHNVSIDLAARIYDGLGLTATNMPAARVRERLLQHATGRIPLRRNEGAAIFIKAFNATVTGRRMRSLSWTPTGPQAESFPIAGQ